MTITFNPKRVVEIVPADVVGYIGADLVFCGFTVIINGNSIEEQLILVMSPGQSGRSTFTAICTSIDGGSTLRKKQTILDLPYGSGPTSDEMQPLLMHILYEWVRPLGTNPIPEDEQKEIDKRVHKTTKRIMKRFGYDFDPERLRVNVPGLKNVFVWGAPKKSSARKAKKK